MQVNNADDNSKFDENGRKLSKWVENTEGKGEIACYEQFLLFPKCFQKACFLGTSKGVIVWKWVNHEVQTDHSTFRKLTDKNKGISPRQPVRNAQAVLVGYFS